MDFLKRHYEKVALAIVSLLLIASALTLMGRLALGGSEDRDTDKNNRAPASPLDTNELAQVAAQLTTPAHWAGQGPSPFIPEQWKYLPDKGELVKADIQGPVKVMPVLDELDWHIRFKTFPMEFKGIAFGEGANATFQINIANAGTRFVKIGQVFKQLIGSTVEEFKVLKLEAKKTQAFNRSTGRMQSVDVSLLTLLRRGTIEIPLTMGQKRLESDPAASYESRVTGERSIEVGKNAIFQYKGKRFKLLDITIRRLVIQDLESGSVHEKTPKSIQGQ